MTVEKVSLIFSEDKDKPIHFSVMMLIISMIGILIYPIDKETIAQSVKKTGRILIVTEGPSSFGVGAELISIINEEAFLSLEAPPARLGGFDTIPPLPKGEHFYFHRPERILYEMQKTMNF